MPKQKQTNDEKPVTLEEVNKTLDRVAKLQEESVRRTAEIDRQMAETDRQMAETDRQMAKTSLQIEKTRLQVEKTSKTVAETSRKMAELNESAKRRDRKLGDLGNKFGDFAVEIEEPSIRQILQVNFHTDFRSNLYAVRENEDELQVDVWGVDYDVKAVYLVTIKKKLKNVHFEELRRQVERFRFYMPQIKEYSICQAVAVKKANKAKRKRVWDSGIYLIDIVNGVCRLAEEPEGFEPKVHRGVPKLRIVHDSSTKGEQS